MPGKPTNRAFYAHTRTRGRAAPGKHPARFDKEPARGTPQNPRKCENSGNKAKKLLKTKEVSFKTNLREANFVPQTSVLIRCSNQSRLKQLGELDPAISGLSRRQTQVLYKAQQNTKMSGNELKDLLQRQGITEIAASKRTHFRAEKKRPMTRNQSPEGAT